MLQVSGSRYWNSFFHTDSCNSTDFVNFALNSGNKIASIEFKFVLRPMYHYAKNMAGSILGLN